MYHLIDTTVMDSCGNSLEPRIKFCEFQFLKSPWQILVGFVDNYRKYENC